MKKIFLSTAALVLAPFAVINSFASKAITTEQSAMPVASSNHPAYIGLNAGYSEFNTPKSNIFPGYNASNQVGGAAFGLFGGYAAQHCRT